jgi:hypothetical protein
LVQVSVGINEAKALSVIKVAPHHLLKEFAFA